MRRIVPLIRLMLVLSLAVAGIRGVQDAHAHDADVQAQVSSVASHGAHAEGSAVEVEHDCDTGHAGQPNCSVGCQHHLVGDIPVVAFGPPLQARLKRLSQNTSGCAAAPSSLLDPPRTI